MTEEVFEKNLILSDPNLEVSLLGNQERFIPVLEEGMNVKVLPFGERITIKGSKKSSRTNLRSTEDFIKKF